jgi:predicted RNA-binding protein with RPS1 domain
MAAYFSTDEEEAIFDEHFVQPAAKVLRGVGSARAETNTIYDALGSIWADAERALCGHQADITAGLVRFAVSHQVTKLWKEIKPTLRGKSKPLMQKWKSIEKQRNLLMNRDMPPLQSTEQPRVQLSQPGQQPLRALPQEDEQQEPTLHPSVPAVPACEVTRTKEVVLDIRTPQLHNTYPATVVQLMPFGAFCEIGNEYRDGLLGISKYDCGLASSSSSNLLYEGQQIYVKVIEVMNDGRYCLDIVPELPVVSPPSLPQSAVEEMKCEREGFLKEDRKRSDTPFNAKTCSCVFPLCARGTNELWRTFLAWAGEPNSNPFHDATEEKAAEAEAAWKKEKGLRARLGVRKGSILGYLKLLREKREAGIELDSYLLKYHSKNRDGKPSAALPRRLRTSKYTRAVREERLAVREKQRRLSGRTSSDAEESQDAQ